MEVCAGDREGGDVTEVSVSAAPPRRRPPPIRRAADPLVGALAAATLLWLVVQVVAALAGAERLHPVTGTTLATDAGTRAVAVEVRGRTGGNVEVPVDAAAFDLDPRHLHAYLEPVTAAPDSDHMQQRLAELAAVYARVQGHDLDALSVWRIDDRDPTSTPTRDRVAVWQP